MASGKQAFTVVGFQYEPVRSSDKTVPLNIYDDVDNDDRRNAEPTAERNASNLSEWCKCGQCKPMPSEQERLCCEEVDAISHSICGRECK